MKDFIEGIIKTGNYRLSDMETRIQRLYVMGSLTEEDMTELLTLAANNANDAQQIDVVEKIAELEDRIFALENAGSNQPVYVVWYNGYVTSKGEVVLYDVDGDGNYEMCRYDGGRASTSLRPFKIDGWHLVDENGNVIEQPGE